MKADPRELLKAHYDTLVDVETGKRKPGDFVLFVALPIAVAAAVWWFGLELPQGVLTGLLTTSGILSGFFFAAMLQVAGRAMDWAGSGPAPSGATSRQARYFKEVIANAGYASLVSIAAAAVFVAALASKDGDAFVLLCALGLGLAVHLMVLLQMVLIRVFRLARDQLTDARTGKIATPSTPSSKS